MSTTLAAHAETDAYLAHFSRLEKELTRSSSPALQRLRKAAMGRFGELGFPTTRHEDWRFTNLAPLVRTAFAPAPAGGHDLTLARLQSVAVGMESTCRLVFVNGYYAPELSRISGLPEGVGMGNLAQVLENQPAAVEAHLARQARFAEHAFTALNTAFFRDGAYLAIPRGKVVTEPIYLVFVVSAPKPIMAHPRNLIVAGSGSQATIVEQYLALGDETYFTNAFTEISVEDGAVLDHYKVQQESLAAFHVAGTHIHQARGSNFSSHYLGLGGSLVRNETHAVLDAERCECTLNGLYQATGRQLLDNTTVIDHAQPHCASHELYKGILDDQANGVFNGKIFVRQDAQKTDAKQTNQTLLLSDEATINTKPQLEIYADDVKCTHGATVGQLDTDALFYLRSRALGLEQARNLLIYAFANDIIRRIKVGPLRERLEQALLARQHLPEIEKEEP